MADFTQEQALTVAEVAVTLGERMTSAGVKAWLTNPGISADRRRETPLDLIQTGEIAVVKLAAAAAVR